MRIALLPPSHCTVCFNQNPQAIHVDMEAAADIPDYVDPDGRHFSSEDVYVCEHCIRAAYDLLPAHQALREQMRTLEADREAAWQYAAKLKKALDAVSDVKAEEAKRPATSDKPKPRSGAARVKV